MYKHIHVHADADTSFFSSRCPRADALAICFLDSLLRVPTGPAVLKNEKIRPVELAVGPEKLLIFGQYGLKN